MQNYNRPYPPKKKPKSHLWILIVIISVIAVFAIILIGVVAGSLAPGLGSKVALLEVNGVIYDSREIIKELRSYVNNSSIKAVVIRVDSPGGSSAASQEIYDEILRLKREKNKPIVVSMGNVAASGGYYIACAADEIFATRSTLTGSIGVIINFTNWEELTEKVGLKFYVIKSGRFKDIGSPNRPMTDKEEKLMQAVIDDVYFQFVDDIYAMRQDEIRRAWEDLTPHAEDDPTTDPARSFLIELADGRIFTGQQAQSYGLVDDLGGLHDAVQRAADLSGIKGKPTVFQKKKKPSLMDILEGDVKQVFGRVAPATPMFEYRYVP